MHISQCRKVNINLLFSHQCRKWLKLYIGFCIFFFLHHQYNNDNQNNDYKNNDVPTIFLYDTNLLPLISTTVVLISWYNTVGFNWKIVSLCMLTQLCLKYKNQYAVFIKYFFPHSTGTPIEKKIKVKTLISAFETNYAASLSFNT